MQYKKKKKDLGKRILIIFFGLFNWPKKDLVEKKILKKFFL